MPPEKTPSKASENRRATKPIMEKRRRARINQCLSELKTLILDALNKDPSRHSKLEKADILEMTVRYLQNMQRQQMAAAISTDPTVLGKFRAGFNECAGEVSRYVERIEGTDLGMRQRLVSHLSHCVSSLNAAAAASTPPPFPGMSSLPGTGPSPSHQNPPPPGASNSPGNNNNNNSNGSNASVAGIAFPGMTPPLLSQLQSLNVQIPGGANSNGNFRMAALNFLPAAAVHAAALAAANGQSSTGNSDINNNNPFREGPANGGDRDNAAARDSHPTVSNKFFGGLPLIPSRLPNGDLAFLLPSQALANGHLFMNNSDHNPQDNDARNSHLHWGPPTPTSPMDPVSPALSRRSTCSPTSTVESALSPVGSEISVFGEDNKGRRFDYRPASSPQPSSSGLSSDGHQRRHPSVIVQAPPVPGSPSTLHPVNQSQRNDPSASDPVWRPW